MKNKVQEGKKLNWTNGTGVAVASGQVVVVGNQIGVACSDIADGASGVLDMDGVFTVPKTAGNGAIVNGSKVLFDISAAEFDVPTAVAEAGDISGCCVAWGGAATGDTTMDVKINVGIGTVEAGA